MVSVSETVIIIGARDGLPPVGREAMNSINDDMSVRVITVGSIERPHNWQRNRFPKNWHHGRDNFLNVIRKLSLP